MEFLLMLAELLAPLPYIFLRLFCRPFWRLLGTTFLEVIVAFFYLEDDKDNDDSLPDANFVDFFTGNLYRFVTEPLVLWKPDPFVVLSIWDLQVDALEVNRPSSLSFFSFIQLFERFSWAFLKSLSYTLNLPFSCYF